MYDQYAANGADAWGGRQPKPFVNQPAHPRLFVGSLPPEVKEDEVKEMFGKYGTIIEFYLNSAKNFAFIRMDTRDGAHRAQMELDGKTIHNRQIRVKRAPHPACIWIGKLPGMVSNEVLAEAFSMFGEIERAVVACDERGKAKGWGFIEFRRKVSVANAIKRCSEGHLLLTNSFQPIKVEPWLFVDDEFGIDHKALAGYPGVEQNLTLPPRLAQPGELDDTFAAKWKKLYEEESKLKSDMQKVIAEKRAALEQEQDKAIREAHEKRRKEFADRDRAYREQAERDLRERAEREERMRRALAPPPPPYGEFGPPAPPMPGYEAPPEMRPRIDGRYDREMLLRPDPHYQAAWEGKEFPMPPPPPGGRDGWRTFENPPEYDP